MTDGKQIAQRAEAAIKQVGVTATFLVSSSGEYSPDTGLVTGAVATRRSALVTPPLSYAQFYRGQDSSAKDGVSVFVMSAHGLGFEPKVGMQLEASSKTWTISKVTAHQFKEVVVAYELEVTLG